MTIKKGTPIARRKGEPENGIQLYTWDSYGSNVMFNRAKFKNNKPTLAQLNAGGYLLQAETVFNQLTHKLVEPYDDSWQDDGVYVTRKTIKLTDEEIANRSADELSDNIKKIDQACRAHIDNSSHWTAGPMIWDKAAKGKPKSKAIQDWTEECWTQYFTNKAMLAGGVQFDESMLTYPACPYDIGEAFQE